MAGVASREDSAAGGSDASNLNVADLHRPPNPLAASCNGAGGERSWHIEGLHPVIEILCQQLSKHVDKFGAPPTVL